MMTLAQNGMIIVIGWQTYTIARTTMSPAGAAAQLGLIGLLQFVPLFVSTPVTGLVADRFDRRLITRCTVALQVLCALILAMATYEGWMTLPVLFSVAVLLGIGARLCRTGLLVARAEPGAARSAADRDRAELDLVAGRHDHRPGDRRLCLFDRPFRRLFPGDRACSASRSSACC